MSPEHRYDEIIIGAGTWGAATAWQLAERGHRVLAIDAFRPPHDHGSHGAATRLARQSNSTGPEYIELTRMAFAEWARIAELTGREVMVKTGNVFVGQPGSKWFDNTLANLRASSFEHEILEGPAARRRFTHLRIGDQELAVWEPNGCVTLVQPALLALQDLAHAAGARFRFDEPVTEWHADDRGVLVRTGASEYEAERLVVTAGAFSNAVLRLELPTRVERQVLVNFALRQDNERLPSVYFAAPPGDDSAPAYGCPDPDGTFKFSVVSRGDVIDPAMLAQNVSERDIERVLTVIRGRLPELTGDAVATTVCMWTESADGHWLFGRHRATDRVIFGAGCNGRGFRYAPVIGTALADLAEAKARPDLRRFDASRFDIAGSVCEPVRTPLTPRPDQEKTHAA